MDIHPVAVIIARVTYLLALAPVLGERRGALSIPVYLGDAMQLSVPSYMQQTELVITVPPQPGHAGQAVVNGGATGKSEDSALSLVGRWNYHNELGSQFPSHSLRVVYAKGGTQPATCLIRDDTAVIDHMLYWAAPDNEDEAFFLIAILNSETARSRVEHLQARGLFGARHFDKVMFTLPIPRFSGREALHRELADLAREAETKAAAFPVAEDAPFQRARRAVREALRTDGVAARIDAAVARLLDRER